MSNKHEKNYNSIYQLRKRIIKSGGFLEVDENTIRMYRMYEKEFKELNGYRYIHTEGEK